MHQIETKEQYHYTFAPSGEMGKKIISKKEAPKRGQFGRGKAALSAPLQGLGSRFAAWPLAAINAISFGIQTKSRPTPSIRTDAAQSLILVTR